MSGLRLADGLDCSTLEDVEAALIDCHVLWWRSPGDARWPFAGDGPWHLMQAEVGDVGAADQSETIITTAQGRELQVRKIETRAPRTPLDAAEVARRDAVTAWLDWLDDPLDRQVVWMATARLQKGEACVPWSKLRRWTRTDRSPSALAQRYLRGLAIILCRLNGWPSRRARAIAAEGMARPAE